VSEPAPPPAAGPAPGDDPVATVPAEIERVLAENHARRRRARSY
jgi:hypothetical protein